MIDLAWLKQLIQMVDESGLDSIEISKGLGTRIRLSKSPSVQVIAGQPHDIGAANPAGIPNVQAPQRPSAIEPTTEEAGAAPGSGEGESPPSGPTLVDITSPMVGTFYRAPAPDAPPYVEVGDRVTQGQTVCILEAMKLMNELESEIGGTIREICVDNADPVEFGQVLFRVEPA